jgi:acetyl-CoA C-acetyltransferase
VQLNRFCASGLEAVNMGAMKVRSGFEDLVVVGGVESMSRLPMGSDGGAWAMDPETNLETGFVPQGIGADLIATIEGFSRTDVDGFALQSQQRAAKARAEGWFKKSVVPVKDQRPDHSGRRRVHQGQLHAGRTGRSEPVVRHDGRDGRLRCRGAAEVSLG